MAKYRVVATQSHEPASVEEVINRYATEENLDLVSIHPGPLAPYGGGRHQMLIVFKTRKPKKSTKVYKPKKLKKVYNWGHPVGQIHQPEGYRPDSTEWKAKAQRQYEQDPDPEQWGYVSLLRNSLNTDQIECEKGFGPEEPTWIPLSDKRWDNCKGPVHWRRVTTGGDADEQG